MSLYTVLLGVQYASVFLMMLECAYITKRWSKPLHGWLFFYCITVLINNAGYLAYMTAQTENEAVISWQFSYLGKAWTGFALLLFTLHLCRGKTYSRFSTILSAFHAVTYFSVLTMQDNGLYYTSFSYEKEGLFPHLVFHNGPWHHIFNSLLVLYMITGISLLVITLLRQKNRHRRRQIHLIMLAVLTDSAFCLIQIGKIVPVYDMNTLGFTISAGLFFIAIFFCDILDSRELAREFVIENISEGIVVASDDGRMAICNSKGRKLLHSLHEDPDEAVMALRQLIADGRPLQAGTEVFSVKEEFLRNKKGVAGRVYLLTDETDHFRSIRELEKQKQIADKANQAKSEFLSNMSHEIRSPINAVLGLDEMILRESGEQHIRGYAADIQSSGKMLLSVINDILDFSKIESGKMEIIPGDYDLSRLISDLVSMINPRAEAKGLAFTVQADENMPHLLYGDETRIKQCALNILTNAVKYTPEGSVTLRIGAERTGETQCTLSFSVTDTGIGIKEEDIAKLFSPFERIEEGRNRAIEGTGLGMSIVKKLLAAMGTQLDVQSVYGKGSTFSFSVVQQVRDWKPIGNYAETKAAGLDQLGAYTERFQAPEAKILVVDDTPVNLTVMQGLLRQTRIRLDTAENGPAALEQARAEKYDVIFIDHRMPGMDGPEMLARLRADERSVNRHTTCIALTANVTGDVKKQYLDAGFDDYLSKPVEPGLLEQLLERSLPAALVLHEGDPGWETAAIRQAGGEQAATGMADGTSGQADMSVMLLDAAGAFFKKRFGLDIAAALTNCGNEDVFADVVKVFHEAIAGKASDIEGFAASGNWQDYTVQVHALKSSARLLGAEELSRMAAELESLGNRARDGDTAGTVPAIQEKTPLLQERYRSYGALLAPLCST